jgi:hypothetical protein
MDWQHPIRYRNEQQIGRGRTDGYSPARSAIIQDDLQIAVSIVVASVDLICSRPRRRLPRPLRCMANVLYRTGQCVPNVGVRRNRHSRKKENSKRVSPSRLVTVDAAPQSRNTQPVRHICYTFSSENFLSASLPELVHACDLMIHLASAIFGIQGNHMHLPHHLTGTSPCPHFPKECFVYIYTFYDKEGV